MGFLACSSEAPVPCSSSGPTPCQLQAEKAFLGTVRALMANSSMPPTLSSIYVPQCRVGGQWNPVQCDGPPEQAFEWYERWRTQNKDGQELTPAALLLKVMSYREAASRNFRLFLQNLYEAGQEGIFPVLAQYSSFQDVPLALLEGNSTRPGENVLLDPYLFWQILNGQLGRYPGPYSDFSAPLAHFDLRSCWCVDEAGQELEGTRAQPSRVPTCEFTRGKDWPGAFSQRLSSGRALSTHAGMEVREAQEGASVGRENPGSQRGAPSHICTGRC